MTIHVSLISTVRINKEAPSGADLDMTIALISTDKTKKAPNGADLIGQYLSFAQIEQKKAQIGADLDIIISPISTVRLNKEAPSGPDLDMTMHLSLSQLE